MPAWSERLVRILDDGWSIPGTRIRLGLDSVVGLLLPGAGDALGAVSALSLFALALQRRVPRVVLVRMAMNVGLDALLGAVPLLGDVFDIGWKANRRNLGLIEQATAAAVSGEPPSTLRDRLFIAAVLILVVCALALPMVVFALLMRALLGE